MADALAAAARGWAVFPCAPRDKVPANGHGFKEATTDQAVIREWWEHWPDANIGLATGQASRLFVLDLDGPQGEESIASLTYGYGDLTWFDGIPTLEATTGKGRHLYFQAPGPVRSRTRLWPGLDVRGDGGYVVMPPSIHPSGRRYQWCNQWPPTLPAEWLVDLINDTFPGKVTAPEPASNVVSLAERRFERVPSLLKDHADSDTRRLKAAKATIRNMSRLEPGHRQDGTFRHGCGLRTMARSEDEWASWVAEVLEVLPYGPSPDGGPPFTRAEASKTLATVPRYAQLATWQPRTQYRPPATNRRWTMNGRGGY